jgi:hypothetical protein
MKSIVSYWANKKMARPQLQPRVDFNQYPSAPRWQTDALSLAQAQDVI